MSEPSRVEYEAFSRSLPEVVAALRTLSRVSTDGLEQGLVELVKVRASQINGCAYCLQLHVNWARRAGVPQGKLDRVAVWYESPDFTASERAALAWTEALTDPARRRELEAARQALASQFTSEQQLRLTVAVATINAWNRVAGPLGFAPPQSE